MTRDMSWLILTRNNYKIEEPVSPMIFPVLKGLTAFNKGIKNQSSILFESK